MRREDRAWLEDALRGVAMGEVAVDDRTGQPAEGRLEAATQGRGRLERYAVYPGIAAAFSVFLAEGARFRHRADPAVLEIYHCRAGRVGWNMREGRSVYLGQGELSLQSADCCASSQMVFPVGYSAGLTLHIDLERLAGGCPDILQAAGFQPRALARRFCTGRPSAFAAGPALEGIFAPVYAAPAPLRPAYLKLKAQELLLYLSGAQPMEALLPQHVSAQTEAVRDIHDLLTGHLDQRFTIEALSRRCLINTSTLKEAFKAVYGLPIAAYMKEYRIRRAMELLRDTDESVAAVAAQVGYETQGKLSKAFKDVTGQTPTQYRRQHRAPQRARQQA